MLKIFGFAFIGLVLIPAQILALCDQHTDCNSCADSLCCWNPATSTCGASLLGICFVGTSHSYNCPADPPTNFVYTDDFGRNKALPFIAATFGNQTQAASCLANRLPDVQLSERYEEANCSGILAINPTDKAIVVAYRGSKGLEQFLLTGLDIFTGAKVPFVTGGSVYLYYYSCFNKIWNAGLGTKLQEYKNDVNYADYELWVFGHSLGGSLASLTSGYAVSQGLFSSDKVKVVTTGQTRTGNLAYAQGHSQAVPNSYRIVNVADSITKLPTKLILDDALSFHHRFEVWYNTNMLPGATFKICKQAEDSTCSASDSTQGDFHNSYFNVPLDTWAETGCQY